MKTFGGPQTMEELMEELIEYDKKIGSRYREPHYKNILYNPEKSVAERVDEIFGKVNSLFPAGADENDDFPANDRRYLEINEFGEVKRYY